MDLRESGIVLLTLGFALAFWVRNLNEMSEIHTLALRVERKWRRLALLHHLVSELNTDVVERARKKDVPVKEGEPQPIYWSSMEQELKRKRGDRD